MEDLRALLSTQSPWRSFAQKYPEFANAVDRIAPYIGMAPEVMQEQLIRLYQTYVYEWDSDGVRDSIGEGLLDYARIQGAAQQDRTLTQGERSLHSGLNPYRD